MSLPDINFFIIYNASFTDSYTITQQECIDLELKLNVTQYGKPWSNIGHTLYNFYKNHSNPNQIVVDDFQFEFLKKLINITS